MFQNMKEIIDTLHSYRTGLSTFQAELPADLFQHYLINLLIFAPKNVEGRKILHKEYVCSFLKNLPSY